MSSHRYRLEGKHPVQEPDLERWAIWWRQANTTVGDTCCERRYRDFVRETLIFTRFTGIDETPGHAKPTLFETVILVSECSDIALSVVERYSTWALAEEGHQYYVDQMSS